MGQLQHHWTIQPTVTPTTPSTHQPYPSAIPTNTLLLLLHCTDAAVALLLLCSLLLLLHGAYHSLCGGP
jgi:hypothetical protein